jgi:ATP-dependent DNA helicase RecQ
MAALYQQLGRAGCDAGGKDVVGAADAAEEGIGGSVEISGPWLANIGLTLFTRRGLATVQFMIGQDLSDALLARMGSRALVCGGVLDAAHVADELIAEDHAAGVLSAPDARAWRTSELYTAGVVRAFAMLAGLGAVEDLGDFLPLDVDHGIGCARW